MKKLMCDFDNVICDNKIIEMANKFLGTNYRFEDVGEGYDFSTVILDEKKLKDLCSYIAKHNFYTGATLKKDCFRVLKELQEKYGYEIYICSSCIFDGYEDISGIIFKNKYDYIVKKLPFINPKNFIFTSAKSVVSGDVMIDDRVKNLNGDFKVKLLFDCWYNAKYSQDKLKAQNIQRVSNWQEIKNILTKQV